MPRALENAMRDRERLLEVSLGRNPQIEDPMYNRPAGCGLQDPWTACASRGMRLRGEDRQVVFGRGPLDPSEVSGPLNVLELCPEFVGGSSPERGTAE